MESQKNSLFLTKESVTVLQMLSSGVLAPFNKLMPPSIAAIVAKDREYNGTSCPFPFVLTPSGKKNEELIESLTGGETVDLVDKDLKKKIGCLKVQSTQKIDPKNRLFQIYLSKEPRNEAMRSTFKNIGPYVVSGDFHLEYNVFTNIKQAIDAKIKETNAKKIGAVISTANPFHRAHENMIRRSIADCDLTVILLQSPYYNSDGLSPAIREKTVLFFTQNYLPSYKTLIIPFINPYMYAGFNELILNALLAKNLGCFRLYVGQNHAGMGLHYDTQGLSGFIQSIKGIDIGFKMMPQYVYCTKCKSTIGKHLCPHGANVQVNFDQESILKLFKAGLIVPEVLVRKEISALILSDLFPNRFEDLDRLFYNLLPNSGLMSETVDDQEFYENFYDLYRMR